MNKLKENLSRRDVLFLIFTLVLVVTQVWLELTMPDYTAKLTASVSGGTADMDTVLKNGGCMLLCAAGSMLASICCGFFTAQVAANLAMKLRGQLFRKITGFGDAEINRFSTASLITRTTNDVVQIQMIVAMGLQLIIKAPITAVWALTKISNTNIEWTAATLITVVLIIMLIGSLVLIVFPKFKKIQRLTDSLNEVTRENISGVRVVRAFNAEDYQQRKFESVNQDITSTQLFTARTMGLMNPIMTLCMSGLTLAIYWIGAYLINEAPLMERAVVIGNMTAFSQYALQVVMSFMMLVAIFIILPRAMVSVTRVREVLTTEPSVTYGDRPQEPQDRGRLEFRDVSFAYADGGRTVLKHLSFTVEPGQTFAIIGATGSGKSSLINLIPRFYDATEGQVLLDGVDVRDYPREQLEKLVSLAPQRAILFRGDIASNVTYGDDQPDEERLRLALNVAQADFVRELPDGVHAEVAQGATNFSGGQKQRLSIARAAYKPAEVMIFDDTFSALDYKTDMLVRKGLREQFRDTTVVLVAQRIGTIMNADRILVLDGGRAVGLGTHEELLKDCPVYREIALSQLSKEEL